MATTALRRLVDSVPGDGQNVLRLASTYGGGTWDRDLIQDPTGVDHEIWDPSYDELWAIPDQI